MRSLWNRIRGGRSLVQLCLCDRHPHVSYRHFLALILGVFLKGISSHSALVYLGKMTLIATVTTVVAIRMFRRRT